MSDYSVHNSSECTMAHVHCEQCKRVSIRDTTSAASVVWHVELRLFRSVVPPFCVSSSIKAVHALALEM